MQHFFQEQQARKRATRLLVVLFLLAVGLIVAFTQWFFGLVFDARIAQNLNLILYQGWDVFRADNPYQIHWFSLIASVCLILGAAIYKLKQLRIGGHVIAEQLGGQLVQPNTYHPLERQLLNVVEEMAIAARTPCPRVYLLVNQSQVNAFAAGHNSKNAVIAVTRGALEKLNRDELQAVVAHEFSHLVNGDIRLNNLLVSLTFSISFIGLLGEVLVQASMHKNTSSHSRKDSSGAAALFGVALICYGFLGTLMADFIKAAVCRHREYLADACATQFNRNPQALADALKVVAGIKSSSRPRNYHQYSHLFFASLIRPWFSWFATHPPITERVKKLEPTWQAPKNLVSRASLNNYQAMHLSATNQAHNNAVATASAQARQDTLTELGISAWLSQQVHEPQNIDYPILALLISPDADIATKQLQGIAKFQQFNLAHFDRTEQQIHHLSLEQRFKLLTTACNALHCLAPWQQANLLKRAQLLYQIIPNELNEQHLFNLATYTLLTAQLEDKQSLKAHFAKADLINAWHYLVAMMAHLGGEENAQKAFIATCNAFKMPPCQLQEKENYNFAQALVSLDLIATLPTKNKSAFVQALEFCAKFDHHLNDDEITILQMLSARLELPVLG
jgi:Zn-dependent protease with chaperone function